MVPGSVSAKGEAEGHRPQAPLRRAGPLASLALSLAAWVEPLLRPSALGRPGAPTSCPRAAGAVRPSGRVAMPILAGPAGCPPSWVLPFWVPPSWVPPSWVLPCWVPALLDAALLGARPLGCPPSWAAGHFPLTHPGGSRRTEHSRAFGDGDQLGRGLWAWEGAASPRPHHSGVGGFPAVLGLGAAGCTVPGCRVVTA